MRKTNRNFRQDVGTTLRVAVLVMATAMLLGSCRENVHNANFDRGRDATDQELADPHNYDDSQALQAQGAHLSKVELTVRAPVLKVLPADTEGLPHERFLLRLSNDTTILVAHDTKFAPVVPINAGDVPVIRGEYIWNSRGGVIHWTHHSDNGRHEGGWIYLNGVRYQ